MFDIIGDVHGCFEELLELLNHLGTWNENIKCYIPNSGRKFIFVGDVIDRGPMPISCLKYIMNLVNNNYAHMVLGNHEDKLKRFLQGNKIKIAHGNDITIKQLKEHEKDDICKFLDLPLFLTFDHLVICHAAWYETLISKGHKRIRAYCLYGPTTGREINGIPERIDWVKTRKVCDTSSLIVYGHQPYEHVRIENKTVGIDTGCVFGGTLSALRWPEMEIVSVNAKMKYAEILSTRSFDH
jgi:protein phosphatase